MWDFFLFQQISSGYLMHFQTTLLEIWIYIYFLESFFKDTSPRELELKRFIEVFHICVSRKPAELQVLCVSPTPHKELTLSSWFVILRGWITFLVPDKNSIKNDTLPPAAFPSLQLPVTNRNGVCRIFHRFYFFYIKSSNFPGCNLLKFTKLFYHSDQKKNIFSDIRVSCSSVNRFWHPSAVTRGRKFLFYFPISFLLDYRRASRISLKTTGAD